NGPRSTAWPPSGSPHSPGAAPRAPPRCWPLTTARRCVSARGAGCTEPLPARGAFARGEGAGLAPAPLGEPARRALAEGARRALSLNANATAYELAIEALGLTEPGDPDRPSLQLLAG